jgi:hypothetical protein
MTDRGKSSHFRPLWKRIWIHGFVIGVGFVLIGFFAWFLISGIPYSSNSQTGEIAPPVQATQVQPGPGANPPAGPPIGSKTPVGASPELQSRLAQVLAGIKEANEKKDLPQLLSYYSPKFPQLQQRVRSISKNWQAYDYLKMDVHLTEVRLLADNATAVARVTWDVETRNISTREKKNLAKSYLVKFVRESGHWRIKALDKAE